MSSHSGASPRSPHYAGHQKADAESAGKAREADGGKWGPCSEKYNEVRPPDNSNNCRQNRGTAPTRTEKAINRV